MFERSILKHDSGWHWNNGQNLFFEITRIFILIKINNYEKLSVPACFLNSLNSGVIM